MPQTKLAPVQAQPRMNIVADGSLTNASSIIIPSAVDCPILIHNRNFPILLATATVATGSDASGTLADGVYGYFFSGSNDIGEGVVGPEICAEVSGGNGSGTVTLSWTDPTAWESPQGHPPVHIYVYGRTSGGPGLKIAEVDVGVQTYKDDGTVTPTGESPATDGSGRTASVEIATRPDEAGRSVDPTSVNPVAFTAGQCKVIGPFTSGWYGQGDQCQDIHLELTCDQIENVAIYTLRP